MIGSSGYYGIATPLVYTGSNNATFYYRRQLNVPDGACFYSLNFDLLVEDGAVRHLLSPLNVGNDIGKECTSS